MRKSHNILTAVAVAGITFAGGFAFTGTGLTNNAGATQFIGGQVSQSVTGATLESVAYAFADTTAKTSVNSITLTFAESARTSLPCLSGPPCRWHAAEIRRWGPSVTCGTGRCR